MEPTKSTITINPRPRPPKELKIVRKKDGTIRAYLDDVELQFMCDVEIEQHYKSWSHRGPVLQGPTFTTVKIYPASVVIEVEGSGE